MKKIISYVFVALAVMAVASCGNMGFKKTKSGLLYKIISDDNGQPAKRGQFIKFSLVVKAHDSVLNKTAQPEYVKVDSTGAEYSPVEIFTMLRKGDSAVVVQYLDTLVRRFGGQPPPYFRKHDKISYHFKVLDVLENQEAVDKERELANEGERQKEDKLIQDYLAKNNITDAKKTPGGTYYQILTHGDGPKADSGKMVSIRYTGYNLAGKFFDSNMDSTKQVQPHPLTPFQFQAGAYGAVPGMVQAIKEFQKGDKGRMFIPGLQGYGQKGSGDVIKPYETLIFDIEVVDVVDAPKPQMPPTMGTPQNNKNNKKGK